MYFYPFSAVQTCPTDQLRLLEYYGLRASSLEAAPVGGLVSVHCEYDNERLTLDAHDDWPGDYNLTLTCRQDGLVHPHMKSATFWVPIPMSTKYTHIQGDPSGW